MGVAVLPFLATAAVAGIIYEGTRSNPPAPTPISRNEQISSTYQPINFTKIPNTHHLNYFLERAVY